MKGGVPNIGELRERLAFQTLTRNDDGQGGATESWATSATVWGMIVPMSASQVFFSDQLQGRVTHKIFIREGAVAVTEEMRISFESRVFHIKSKRDVGERDRFLEIMAEEGAAS